MNERVPLDPRMEYLHAQRQLESAVSMGSVPEISRQEVAFVTFVRQGLPYNTAGRCAGMTSQHVQAFTEDDRFIAAMQYSMERASAVLNVTTDMLNYMLMEAHAGAINTTEQVMAIRELGKLNGLYPAAAPARVGALLEHGKPANARGMQAMPDETLLEHAGYDALDPVKVTRE